MTVQATLGLDHWLADYWVIRYADGTCLGDHPGQPRLYTRRKDADEALRLDARVENKPGAHVVRVEAHVLPVAAIAERGTRR